MNDYRFRAWDMRKEEMFDVAMFSSSRVYETSYHNDVNLYAPRSQTELMMCSGLLDINLEDIFEGDLATDEDNEIVGVVIFEDGAFYFEWDNITELLSDAYLNIKVIGDKFNNPELFERVYNNG